MSIGTKKERVRHLKSVGSLGRTSSSFRASGDHMLCVADIEKKYQLAATNILWVL
jgi:hypothetical protein